MKHLKRALRDANKAIQADIYDATTFMRRGLIYKELGQMDDYYEDFRVAVLLDGDLVNHETHGAEFARILKKHAEEEAEWEEIVNSPESIALLEVWEEEALEELKKRKSVT